MARRAAVVRELFRLLEEDGIDAVISATPDDVVWTPLGGGGQQFVGAEIRDYFAAQAAAGSAQTHRLYELEVHGEAIVARGAVHLHAPEAHQAFQPTWVYEFEGERLRRATGYPTYRDALAALEGRPR
ncbi:nuclear transport factor 2 family protein [Paraconexibacter algicola]|uniref:SnoaL-like domain-containing protein n=1 Tax=Paraconexibacter algicola TaxID=2133960 RepID=A0A2T4ULC2_9ACTN|nr:nuclear transport factor 2 family protein [Paraconexibacter algicola]PTL59998.1 hypothetical protein C7Y72_10235 [Paraconexibacter algicola]